MGAPLLERLELESVGLCTKPTDKPDDVEGGVGENRCAGLTEAVV